MPMIAATRALVLASFVVLAPIGAARAQTTLGDGQRNAIENVAQAIAGTQVCQRYETNVGLLTVLALRYRLRFQDPGVKALLEERTLFHANRIKGRTADDICAALLRLFGPEGSNLKNLVRPRA